MPLFGDLDASEVSDNPFYVADDVYNCILSEATVNEKNDGSGKGLALKWTIEEDDSDFDGQNISDWFNVYPTVTSADLEAMDSDERTKVRRDRSNLKKRLNQLQLSDEEMNNLFDEDGEANDEALGDLVGITAQVEVVNNKDKHDPDKVYTNIKNVKRTDGIDD